ncbi:MAG: potassium channel family protein [Verrucomicrobia bacterium]|nr:potassium channel family protein [Verrucomicrobiota bacterium]
MDIAPEHLQYGIALKEIVWSGTLVGTTLAMHGLGMIWILHVIDRMQHRFAANQSFTRGLALVILASWLIILVHLVEVVLWAGFFLWQGALPNPSIACYFSLMQYTTVGSSIDLPLQWRLLQGMISIAGLMTFAWSTAVLLTLVRDFQDQQVQLLNARKGRRQAAPVQPGAEHGKQNN